VIATVRRKKKEERILRAKANRLRVERQRAAALHPHAELDAKVHREFDVRICMRSTGREMVAGGGMATREGARGNPRRGGPLRSKSPRK
jgi:hypothetical protein